MSFPKLSQNVSCLFLLSYNVLQIILHVGLLYDLVRIAQKLGAVVGEGDAAAGARKDLQVELLFQAFDGV